MLKAEEAAHVEPNRKTWARLWKNQADLRAILEGWDPPREEKQCLNCGQFYEGNDGCPFCGSSDFERDDWLPAGWQYYGSIFGLWKHFSGREL